MCTDAIWTTVYVRRNREKMEFLIFLGIYHDSNENYLSYEKISNRKLEDLFETNNFVY